jgi:hypothetical protein
MNEDHFVKVFDVLDSGFRDWTFSAFGLIFVAIGMALVVSPKLIKLAGIPFLDMRPKARTFFAWSWLVFSILWTALTFFGTYSEYLRHTALVRVDGCRLVQGPVEHFVPMPHEGHAEESFSVSGVPFKYSDFGVTDGFNNTSSYGGPINSGSYVRICYDPSGNVILRLEIRNFEGPLKDYAKAWPIFAPDTYVPETKATRLDGRRLRADLFGYLFTAILVIDLTAILTLFIPYMRTFFRLGTRPVSDCGIPRTIEAGQQSKLRNSMIYWERATGVIWLRPRGLNLFQMPFTVARLNTDVNGRSISNIEIRHSWAPAILLAAFLWVVGGDLFADAPIDLNVSLRALFAGIMVLMIFIGVVVGLRGLRWRMESLLEDAISEFKAMCSSSGLPQ